MWVIMNVFSYPGFADSEEAAAIQRMLSAYDQCDDEVVMRIVKSPLFRYMDNDVSKTIWKIPLRERHQL